MTYSVILKPSLELQHPIADGFQLLHRDIPKEEEIGNQVSKVQDLEK